MRVAVSPDLVPCGRNLANHLGMLFCYVSKYKEGRTSSRFFENTQQPAARLDHAVLVAGPFGMGNLETLIPVFKINGQGIGDRLHYFDRTQSVNSRCQSSNIKRVHN